MPMDTIPNKPLFEGPAMPDILPVVGHEALGVTNVSEVNVAFVVVVGSTRPRVMLERLEENLARVGVLEEEPRPKWFTADAGYCSEANLGMLAERQIDAYVATGRERYHRGGIAHGNRTRTPLRAAMRDKLQTTEGRAIYARRKAITEPVHGLIKQAQGFRQFLLRGLDKVAGEEFTLIALTHNLLKLWRAGLAPTG